MSESIDGRDPVLDETTDTAGAAPVPGDRPDAATPEPAADAVAEASGETGEAAAEGGAAAAAKPRPVAPGLYRAFRSGRPVRGKVERVIKGGYEIRIGRARGFCPHSQIGLTRIEDAESMVGQALNFRVTQVRRGGAEVVVSRRAMLEDRRKDEAAAVRATLVEGAVTSGRVASLVDFGAFIDLGAGVTGLVHATEIEHGRIADPSQALTVGDSVAVKVLKIDDAKGRVSLSIRQAKEDPWARCVERFPVGQSFPGTVRRIVDFGAFVELAPGLEALAPAGEFPPHRMGFAHDLEAGTSREWIVLNVEARRRRIALAPSVTGVDRPVLEVGMKRTGQVQRVERFGVFVWFGPGQVGMMPSALTGTPPGSDLTRRFGIGDDVEVEVIGIEEDGRRIRVASIHAKPREDAPRMRRERSDGPRPDNGHRRPRNAPPPAQVATGTFGTNLADKLRAALARADTP